MVGYSSFEALRLEMRGRVLVITLDNQPLNLITPQIHEELSRIFAVVNRDPDVAVVVITGAGDRAFSAGADINLSAQRLERGDHADWLRATAEARDLTYSLLRFEKPLIARINGHAIGVSANIAVMSDFSYMMAKAKIADTHVKIGLSAGDGGAMMWPILMGFAKARHYLLTGDALTGAEAAELGLITKAAESIEELDSLAYGMAERLAKGPGRAINATKTSINLLLRNMFEGVVEAHGGLQMGTYLSKDYRAAVMAFKEGQEPIFSGE